MVAYSFKAMFVDPIRLGLKPGPYKPGMKRHTIRDNGKRRHARQGETLQLYRGMRSKSCFKIGDARCSEAYPITIKFLAGDNSVHSPGIGTIATREGLDAFARTDGFESWERLREFWALNHPGVTIFKGTIIRWEPIS